MVPIFFSLSLVSVFLIHTAAVGGSIEGMPTVIDGDTLNINGERIRLHGIDAPEARQACTRDDVEWLCGQEASKALRDYLRDQPPLECKQVDTDRYGRIVAKCYTSNDVDIGEWMVRNGWALAYRRYSEDYVSAEENARIAKHGLWSGKFVEPWLWRRQ